MKLRHWCNCALLIILPLPLPLMADQQLELTAVANSPDTGVSGEVLKEAYRRLGIDISILKLGASEALQRSNSGSADGEVQRIEIERLAQPEDFQDWISEGDHIRTKGNQRHAGADG